MFDLIFIKDDSLFFEKKLASTREAPQEMDAKFRFAIHPQLTTRNQTIPRQLQNARLVPQWRYAFSLQNNNRFMIPLLNVYINLMEWIISIGRL